MAKHKPDKLDVNIEWADFEVIVSGFGFPSGGTMKLYKKGDIVSLPVNHGKTFSKFVKPAKKRKD
jgi:hypothetical protein